MPKARVTSMRNLSVAAPDFEKTVAFYEGPWGLKKVEQESGIAYFAAEGSPENYILRIRKSDEKRIDLIAFGADDAAAVDDLAASLAADGFRFASEPGTLQTPGGGYGFRFFDPDGRTIEISADVERRPYREIEERDPTPVKLSHIVLGSANFEAERAMFEDKLGFKMSDWFIDGGLVFYRCTNDHHGIAVGPAKSSKLNHMAFEMRGIDEQHQATGRMFREGTKLRNGIVRHLFGDNVSSYFWDPNGNVSEYTAEIERIPFEGGREPRLYRREQNIDLWGVQREPDEVPENALVAEVGHFVAPPV